MFEKCLKRDQVLQLLKSFTREKIYILQQQTQLSRRCQEFLAICEDTQKLLSSEEVKFIITKIHVIGWFYGSVFKHSP